MSENQAEEAWQAQTVPKQRSGLVDLADETRQ